MENKTALRPKIKAVSVIAPPPLISFVESPVGASACLDSMLCARSSRTTSPTLRFSGHRPLPLLMPIAATVSEASKFHHACSAEGTDKVTYGGDQARTAVCNYGKRSHKVSPCCGDSSPPNAVNPKRGRERAGEGVSANRAAAPCFGFKPKSN
jgi:hypothetical protein